MDGYHNFDGYSLSSAEAGKFRWEIPGGPVDVGALTAAWCDRHDDWSRNTRVQLSAFTHDEPLAACWPYNRNDMLPNQGVLVGAWRTDYEDRTHWEGDGDGVPSYLKKMSIEELRAIRRPLGRYTPIIQEFVESGEQIAEIDLSLLGVAVSPARNGFGSMLRSHPQFTDVLVRERLGRLFLVKKDALVEE